MLNQLWENPAIVGIPVLLCIATLAIIKGGPAARQATLIFLGVTLAVTAANMFAAKQAPTIGLVGDALLALAFLWLAMRHRSLWLAGAMIAQGTAFAFHAFLLEQENSKVDDRTYFIFAVGMNLMTWLVMLLILTGTIIAWRKRRHRIAAAKSATPSAAPEPLAPRADSGLTPAS